MRRRTDTIASRLAARAQRQPEDIALIDAETGQRITYGELDRDSRRLAAQLRALGVGPGDPVATMFRHSIDTYRVWFALAALRALEVPIGTRYRGRLLAHILTDSDARVLIVDAEHVADVAAAGAMPPTVIVRGESPRSVRGLNVRRLDELRDGPAVRPSPPEAHELAVVIYTSGTTGPSKGVLVPWGQVQATVEGAFPDATFAGGPKVIYGPFPPNHIGGRLFAALGIHEGVPAVIRHVFSASSFWADVDAYGATTTGLVSAMATILLNAPQRPDDADHALEDVLLVPLIADYAEFERRFAVRICTSFNMTEVSIPTGSGWTIDDWRSCGRARPGFPGYHVRVVDEHDHPVEPGVTGELICRTDEPWTMNAGYYRRPVETAAAWRNGWFHTGDAFRRDADGRYFFIDRIKDAIRRRGENISSIEVEQEVLDHPDVLSCAAIGVPSELGEQDIKVYVVRRAGAAVTEAELIEHVASKAASFMVPRYVEFVASLPTTEGTDRVKKSELRDRARTLG